MLISDGRGFLEAALLASSTNESSVGPAEAATPEAQPTDEAPQAEIGLSPAANSIIQSLTPDAAAQVRQAAQ